MEQNSEPRNTYGNFIFSFEYGNFTLDRGGMANQYGKDRLVN